MKTIIAIFTITLAFSISVQAQNLRKVYGYVKNSYGQPVEKVKVTSQEKFSKTCTDAKGWYLLEVPESDTILYYLHDDYRVLTQKRALTSRIDVVIEPKKNSQIINRNFEMADETVPMVIRLITSRFPVRPSAVLFL